MSDAERTVYSVHIDGTKEAVWHELTRTDQPQAALWNAVLHCAKLEPGSPYQMRTQDGRFVNALGEILACDPPTLLKQSMRFTQLDDPFCTVTYEIADAPQGGVELTLTVDDLRPDTKTGKSWRGSGGAAFVCNTLKRVVEKGKASFSLRAMYGVFGLLGPLAMPKRSRVEHWPMDG